MAAIPVSQSNREVGNDLALDKTPDQRRANLKNGAHTILFGILGILISACDADTRSTSMADAKVLDGMARAVQPTCVAAYHSRSQSEQKRFFDSLSANNMTVGDYCKCFGQTMFGSLSQEDLDQYLRDAVKYETKITEYEPHRTRALRAAASCVAGQWPGNT